MSTSAGIVVVGGGQAGFQLQQALRSQGFDGRISLLADEPFLPYQRPPLSKAYLKGEATDDDLAFATADFYRDSGVEIIEDRAAAIDPRTKTVTLSRAGSLSFDRLILATGARNRRLPGLEGVHGLVSLRTLANAQELRDRLLATGDIVIIGAGYLGLEVASVSADMGASVRVIEMAPRLMSRSASPAVSRLFQERLEARGVRFELASSGVRVLHHGGQVTGVEWNGGSVRTKLVLACIGVDPNTELARDAGLDVANGILTDGYLRTAVPEIYAIGDCAAYPNIHFGQTVRLESVQNAVDQANCVAAAIVGEARPYASLPWFWSEQAGMKLQIAGNTTGQAQEIVVDGDHQAGALSAFHFRDDVLVGVESVNRPKDHMLARKILRSRQVISAAMLPQLLAPAPAA
ncbi:FAD-dependent oxidoreductase [Aminobacter anthyllidis]|uniref:FAD-dependent oxidoreductase n=1 Tax=Aminobacter anthyllidis TaxID=1035067 RepID=A0A9X1D5G1_9HYPH|nr:FAD-dependent oxidoreductase [Aminobacter anthyllidis]MBT1157157.1 FAD-dependent oxidoreductase [Aminobacter anthyllidis]